MSDVKPQVSEEESRRVAEESRETTWKNPSFMKELFLGNFQFKLIHPYPERTEWRPEFEAFFEKLTVFLRDTWDAVEVDDSGEYNMEHVAQLAEMGAFGMKIPTEYGGLGFDQLEYAQVMELLGCCDGNLTALLSAHQSIGVPQPLLIFGTEEQKKKYLPRVATGEISAFAPPIKPINTSRPPVARASRFCARYEPPIESRITSTPAPPVAALASATKSPSR